MVFALCFPAFAQGTAFTYQGRLQNNGGPAGGTGNLTFSLFNVSRGGSAVAGPVTPNGFLIPNGLFTVTLDFGSNVFNGTVYWLEIGGNSRIKQKLELKETEILELKRQNDALEKRLDNLAKVVKSLNDKN